MSEFSNWESQKTTALVIATFTFSKKDLMQTFSYEYSNMQNQNPGTDNHILTKMETISGL